MAGIAADLQAYLTIGGENESTVEAALRVDGRIVDDDDVGWWFIGRRWLSATRANHLYHAFERQVIAGLPQEDDWEITSAQIDEWLRGPGAEVLRDRRSWRDTPPGRSRSTPGCTSRHFSRA